MVTSRSLMAQIPQTSGEGIAPKTPWCFASRYLCTPRSWCRHIAAWPLTHLAFDDEALGAAVDDEDLGTGSM
jgi:hypothetical protein